MKTEKIPLACRRAWEKAGRGKMLLAVSGGADSTALFIAFSKASIPFEVAHCNFNLRASESLRDREFVKMLCKTYDIPIHVVEFDVPRDALKGESTEMTCRRLRYDYFKKLKKEGSFDRIVVAHNADDNMETFFLHALRGSGSRGLMGMEEDNGEILRPLLPYRRREIIEFLEANHQNYVVDSSNLKSEDYRRNFLRNEVFPLLESKWEGFATAVQTTIEIQKRERKIVEHFTNKALEECRDFLPWHIVYGFPDPATIIFRFIQPFGGTPTVAREMAASSLSLLPGKEWRLNDTDKALFTRKGIRIITASTDTEKENSGYHWEKIEGTDIDIDKIMSAPLSEVFLTGSPENFKWENASIGMKIKSLGLAGSQPVWKVLKDAGLTVAERKCFKVLVERETGEPVWLPGIKRSRLHLVSPSDTVIYHISK